MYRLDARATMIRLLGEKDREQALDFLDRDHEFNLIMIYDIDHFGIEDQGHPFQGEYYGAFRGGEMGGIAALFNFGSLFLYTPDLDLAPELVDHMASLERKPTYVIGHAEWAGPFMDRLMEQGVKPAGEEAQDYMALSGERFRPRFDPAARFAVTADFERLMELHRAFQLEYFGSLDEAEEELGRMAVERMQDNGIAVAIVDGEIVSKAEIMVRTSRAALIGGVYTVPAYRGKGLSFACMSLLCKGILENIGKACLNVSKENAPAQRIYRSIGFEKLSDYRMAHFIHTRG
jgi:predicted GNAT family acetyltransferase